MLDKTDYMRKNINMPLTLEQHFDWLSKQYPAVQDLHSLWHLLRKDIEEELPNSRGIFVHYSLHDASHSRTIIKSIERFLGDDRIAQLSATDTFMLLICAYAHDYGMAMSFNQVYEALGTQDFENFIQKQKDISLTLSQEEEQAVSNLISFMQCGEPTVSLQEQYFSIMMVIQMYLRPTHWRRAGNIWNDFQGLLHGRLNGRFVRGKEGIINICEAHGKEFNDIFKMSFRADGIVGDDFHPRFVAAMLRLGDLLDLDNGRFPRWFASEISHDKKNIPKLSVLHYCKHEAISHLLITPKGIEISAACFSKENGYETADLISDWIEWVSEECTNQVQYWSAISQADFGRPPTIAYVEILIDDKPYKSESHTLQMVMPQERVMELLEGTNIYQDHYVGIREMVQNAVDASLLQMWYDITHNRYYNIGVSKKGQKIKGEEGVQHETDKQLQKEEISMLDYTQNEFAAIFDNYDIMVELIQDVSEQKVYITVKDKGTGVTEEDAKFMSSIGTSKNKNTRLINMMKDMPRWLKPSGIFGIGLQSVFQLTDRIEFYTRQPSEPERLIIFHSYGRNHGKVEIQEVVPDSNDIFYDNAVPGTNVKIAVEPKKILSNTSSEKGNKKDHFLFYDREFDSKDTFHALYVELSRVIEKKLREYPCDYFNIYFQTLKNMPDGSTVKGEKQRLRYSYFSPYKNRYSLEASQKKFYSNTILPFLEAQASGGERGFCFKNDMAYYNDEKECRIYRLSVRPCEVQIEGEDKKMLELPEPVRTLYRFQYKFNPLSDAESIYPLPIRRVRGKHAGFIYWDINIMDDNPTKYLNIDRDRLREGAIMEEDLALVRKSILQHWCDYLIVQYQSSEERRIKRENKARAKYVYQGKEDKLKIKDGKNPYKEIPGVLVSLIILFYQYMPLDKFCDFIDIYSDFFNKEELWLKNENFTVDKLWDKETEFYFIDQCPNTWIKNISQETMYTKSDGALEMHADTIMRLPHRLLHIFKIFYNSNGEVCYCFRLGQISDIPNKILMDEVARFYDYSMAIEADENNPKRPNVDSLVRKIFKPNEEYPNLLVSRYPKSFQRNKNFSLPLDHCIRWYILSPFDREMTKILENRMDCKKYPNVNDTLADVKERLKNYLPKSTHFEKCVQYVYERQTEQLRKLEMTPSDNLIEVIREEYGKFALDCCTLLISHRELLYKKFGKRKSNVIKQK